MVPQLASDARELGSDRRRSSDADRSQMIYRGQLLVRDCGASRKTYSSDTIGTEFRRDYAFVGLAEVEKRRYPAHFIRGFLQRGSLSDLSFQTTDFYQRSPLRRGCDLAGLVHETTCPPPHTQFRTGGAG